MENEQKEQVDEIFASWEVPEYNHHERDIRWYSIAIAISIGLLIYSFFTDNFLLPVIIIIVAFIFIMQHGQEPERIIINISSEGLGIGQKFYDFDLFNNFGIVYKPKLGDKNLYFEFKNVTKMRISIPLQDTNPIEIRKFLLKFLKEDLERADIPLSEQLAKMFKL